MATLRRVPLLLVAVLVGCKKDDEVTWTQYNADDNAVLVEVGAAELLPAVAVTLTSSTGSVDIGTGSADPGGGPINDTVYTVRVELLADYADDIDRVSLRTSSGDRGEDEFEMTEDSAGLGIWVYQLQAVGDEGETRSDTLTFRLWDATTGDTAS